MKDENFEGIMAGIEDAIAFVNGNEARGQVVSSPNIKAIRKAAGKTQGQFASTFHLPVATVRDWEQGRRQPDAPARALLAMIAADPVTAEQLIGKAYV